MSLRMQPEDFQHLLRICNTNIDGRQKVMYAITSIPGIGRRFSNLILKKCDVDMNKRAGELTPEEINKIVAVVANPTQFRIPTWYLNRQRDYKDGKNVQVYAQTVVTKLRDDIERMKKIRCHRGLRHYWCVNVRGQHTKTTGRHGGMGGAKSMFGGAK